MRLHAQGNHLGNHDTGALVECLELWYDAVRSIDAILPEAKLGALADEVLPATAWPALSILFSTQHPYPKCSPPAPSQCT